MPPNPCLHCGACCAHFRASFYWQETDEATPGGVPVELTEDLTPFRRVMKGTNAKAPRCIALVGDIGAAVFCSIYDRRSSICRAFDASYINGEPNERCDRARAAYGLAPLRPEDWLEPEEDGEPPVPRRPRPRTPRRAA